MDSLHLIRIPENYQVAKLLIGLQVGFVLTAIALGWSVWIVALLGVFALNSVISLRKRMRSEVTELLITKQSLQITQNDGSSHTYNSEELTGELYLELFVLYKKSSSPSGFGLFSVLSSIVTFLIRLVFYSQGTKRIKGERIMEGQYLNWKVARASLSNNFAELGYGEVELITDDKRFGDIMGSAHFVLWVLMLLFQPVVFLIFLILIFK